MSLGSILIPCLKARNQRGNREIKQHKASWSRHSDMAVAPLPGKLSRRLALLNPARAIQVNVKSQEKGSWGQQGSEAYLPGAVG